MPKVKKNMTSKKAKNLKNKKSETKKLTKKTPKKSAKQKKDEIKTQLVAWAHEGSKEAVQNIEKFLVEEEGAKMKSFAEMALDEAWFMYLSPRNKKEENELLLAKVIDEKMRHLDDLETKAEGARFDVEKLLLERKMHNRVMKGKLSKAKKEDWKYNFCEDWLTMVKGRLAELEAEIEYESKWLDTATASLTTERYRIIPFGFFDHYHWDYEDVDYWGRDFRSEDDEPEEFDDDFVDERLNGPDFFDKLS